ncbi:MAG: acyl-CoA dehydrogenase family protein [Bacteroidales bacterium]|jgi:alkylation response protein AidB-like acyl-CoA dehydrogenase|nr:acyl-CoA dehydrogenase family protein [Bacteroidales bacterium]
MNKKIYHPLIEEKHEALRSRVRTFALREIQPVAAKLDEHSTFSTEITKKMGQLGLFGMTIPKTYGGQNLDTLSYIIAVEELARIDSSQAATVAAHNSLGLGPIWQYGSEEQKKQLLPRLTTGDYVWAFGLTEPNAGSDAKAIETTARLENSHWMINGQKVFITNSTSKASMGITLLANTSNNPDHKEYSAILVEKEKSTYQAQSIKNKMVWRAADTGRLTFKDTRVPKENLLGDPGKGLRIILETLDAGRLSVAAIGLGLAQGALDMAKEYSFQRKQFGSSLNKFQVIAHKLVDMEVKIELARNYLYTSCWLKDQGAPFAKQAAISKLYTSEIAREIADEAVQVFGGYGLFKDNAIERFYRDQRILSIGEGTSEILKMVIGKKMGI